ncbi:unnamed protein product, partial [Prunus armeniaca]
EPQPNPQGTTISQAKATLERGDENLTKVSFCTQQEGLSFSSSAAARSAYFQSFGLPQ